jgi:Holliday junction resolvase-like predicted endonuclease
MSGRRERINSILSNITVPESELSDFESDFRDELTDAAVELLRSLGYQSDNIFLNVQLETPERVRLTFGWGIIPFDVIAAKRVTAPPYLAIKTDLGSARATESFDDRPLSAEEDQFLRACAGTSRAAYTVVLTNAYIAIAAPRRNVDVYLLSEFDEQDAEELIKKLSPPSPDDYPEGRSTHFPAGYHPNQTKLTRWLFTDSKITPEYRSEINTEFFQLDIDEYADRLYDAYTASSAQEKGNTLEDVVEFLFNGLNLVNVRDRNLRTRTGEIDIILEYIGADSQNLFEYESRYVVVECKNIDETVPAKEVAHFEKKLIKSNVSVGFLVSWNGISGENSGDYAQRYVDSDTSDDTKIIVIDSRDLYRILDGLSLYELIDEKMYSLRFDL